jgi:AcrR family transcriptional regulator
MSSSERNEQKSSSYDELLLAGIEAVARFGLDRVTVADVIKISGHSRPTFYSYFGDINGMLAEIWIRFGREMLDSQLYEVGAGAAPVERNLDLESTLMQIMCAAHRLPEVQEILVPDYADWWKQATKGNHYIELKLSWILAIKIGIALSEHIDPQHQIAGMVLPILRTMPDNLDGSPLLAGLGDFPPFPEANSVIVEAETTEDAIMNATIEVVANSGVGAASVARIARKSRVSTGSIYPRFTTGRDLVEKSFDRAIADVVRGNLEQAGDMGFGADQYGLTIRTGFGDNRKVWRNYRIEMFLASMHDEGIRNKMVPGFETTRQQLVDGISTVPEFGTALSQPLSYLMQVLGLGLSILHNAGLELAQLDHRIPARYIGAAIAQAK